MVKRLGTLLGVTHRVKGMRLAGGIPYQLSYFFFEVMYIIKG